MRAGDAFGLALYDAHRGLGRGFQMTERDDGHIDATETRVYFTSFRQWSIDERRAMRYVRGRVLDIGCGAGRHSIYLQKRGFDVIGIDVSPLALRVSRLRGLRRTAQASVTHVNSHLGVFDTILMLGNNFGLFGNRRRAQTLLRRWHRITRPGARIIAQSRDPYAAASPSHRAYHRRNLERGRMCGQIRMRVRYQDRATPWFDYLIASKMEMRQIVAGTGWRIRRFLPSGGPLYSAIIER